MHPLNKNVPSIFLIVLILVFPLLACTAKCNVQKYHDAVDPIAKKWDDAVTLANSTPRMTLPNQISELQSIERDAETVEVDKCMADAHAELVTSMKATIDGFLAFLGEKPDQEITAHFQKADIHLTQWKKMLVAAEEK